MKAFWIVLAASLSVPAALAGDACWFQAKGVCKTGVVRDGACGQGDSRAKASFDTEAECEASLPIQDESSEPIGSLDAPEGFGLLVDHSQITPETLGEKKSPDPKQRYSKKRKDAPSGGSNQVSGTSKGSDSNGSSSAE